MHNFQCVNFTHFKWLPLCKVFHSRFLEFMCTLYNVDCTRLLRVHFMRILSKIFVCLDIWFSCKISRLESLFFHPKNHLKKKTVFYWNTPSINIFSKRSFSQMHQTFSNISSLQYNNNVWRNFQLYTTIRVLAPLKTDYPI